MAVRGSYSPQKQDPKNPLGYHLLFAPDVCQGPDGRYYLYYAFDFLGIMSVAVCDTPAGEYKFLGHIHYADGTLWGRRREISFRLIPAFWQMMTGACGCIPAFIMQCLLF